MALDAGAGCAIARDITSAYSEGIEPRGGVAFGDVITRHGDYYGTVVNLASRSGRAGRPRRGPGRTGRPRRRPAVRSPSARRDGACSRDSTSPSRCSRWTWRRGRSRRVPRPRIEPARPLPIARRGQRPLARLPLPTRRHRHQHPLEERDHLGPDDLRPAHLPTRRAPRAALPAVPVARLADHPPGQGVRRARGAAPPAVHQEPHTRSTGSPSTPRCTYIVAMRDPLDMAVSLYHQGENLDRGRIRPAPRPARARGAAGAPPAAARWLLSWIAEDADPRQQLDSLPGVMAHFTDAWRRRHQSNIVLVHYDDLSADLGGEMRRLAGRLAIECARPGVAGPDRRRQLRRHAGRCRSDRTRSVRDPEGPAAFFRRGTSGAGRRTAQRRRAGRLPEPRGGIGPARPGPVAAAGRPGSGLSTPRRLAFAPPKWSGVAQAGGGTGR